MDALSEALTSVRMTGAIFYHAECTAPWGFQVPHLQKVAHVLAPGTERLVSYHLVTDGKAVVRFPGEEDIAVAAGDILIIPHGDAHTVSNGSPSTFLDSGASLDKFLAGSLTTMRLGGGGETTRFVCGYFGCERHADRLFLAGLPLMIKINLRGDAAGEWLESSVRHLVSQAGSARPGQSVLLSKMAEALFIETHSPLHGGVAAGADRLACGCARSGRRRCAGASAPEASASLERGQLAVETGVSRSVLAERFSRFLGEPPLTYLARWRLQLAARMLQTTRKRCYRWRPRSATIRKRRSIAHSSASLVFRQDNSGARPPDRDQLVATGQLAAAPPNWPSTKIRSSREIDEPG